MATIHFNIDLELPINKQIEAIKKEIVEYFNSLERHKSRLAIWDGDGDPPDSYL